MNLAFATYDVFTARRFGGNPLAIVMEADRLSTEQMQSIAREFNLSETIFVMAPESPVNTAKVRIFLPQVEIPFAGHPTVGCAIHLAARKYKAGCSFETEVRLEEKAGVVPVKVSRIGDVPHAMFTAPVTPFALARAVPEQADIAAALSLAPEKIGFEGHAPGLHQGGPSFLFIPVSGGDALASVCVSEPHWSRLMEKSGVLGAYVYARGGEQEKTAFRGRMFAPGSGIPEDPATGAATALLASQLLACGEWADGTHRLWLEQGYEMGRPSQLRLEFDVKGQALVSVRVAGQAVQVMEGTIEL
ncbi:PhzF family phenazine biosynthesis protein [Aestuariivirga sp.]|uniref:PhzF family phenazine biosynthesis protein n=1 Tax=Aestuariivirga sp. TaxID=2650926 RepID=UPI0039E58E6B